MSSIYAEEAYREEAIPFVIYNNELRSKNSTIKSKIIIRIWNKWGSSWDFETSL